VGLLLIQLLKLRGGTVITATSTPEKAELAREAGSSHVLDYAEVPRRVRELTGGRGVDVVYDGIGKDTFEGPWTPCGYAVHIRPGGRRKTQGHHRRPLSPEACRFRPRSDGVACNSRQGHPASVAPRERPVR
jgi:threonine dehydrogenase-like Zn-dependent dehydrogenase